MLMHTHEARLDALRKELARRGLDGFVVPIGDEHLSEYVPSYAERLGWLTGFGGSAGFAVVLAESAAIFVDGRYTVQVREQVAERLFEYRAIPGDDLAGWIETHAKDGARIGYDAWLHPLRWARRTAAALEKGGRALIPVEDNPIDAVWQDRPAPSDAPLTVQPDDLAGRSSADKRGEIADWLRGEGADALVLGTLDAVAWTLNIRGGDVDHTPVALAYALVHADATAELFVAPDKVTDAVRRHLGNAVTLRDRTAFADALNALDGKTVALDPDAAVAGIAQALSDGGATLLERRDPTALPKARKTPAEAQGHREAQARDGVAVAKFLHWLDIEAPKGRQTELSAAAQLLVFRQENDGLVDLSFPTISAAGAHAALPHYRVDEDSDAPLDPGSVYLCDSGGQYRDGTTDITRTVWIAGEGEAAAPPKEVRDRFTRVLKGHIALATLTFPDGTSGGQIDGFARAPLWSAGLDYAHGTGHGVGAFLGVHEGPQRIAKPTGGQAGTGEPLRSGMICSNEPGYYKPGAYGIRIENLVLVREAAIEGAEGSYLGFETLTHVPIARAMIEPALLTPAERGWIDAYHARTRDILAPQLEGEVRDWVVEACQPLNG